MAGYNFKNEEEVQLYLKNLYTEYKFGCYNEKNPEVCHLLGDYEEAITRNFKSAAEIYKKNCDNLDYGRSCTKIGGYKSVGKGCKKDIIQAHRYMKKGCELGHETGCVNAGIVSITFDNIAEDRVAEANQGIKNLSKACLENKVEKACFFLSGMYKRGIEGIVEKNLVESYKYCLKSCEYKNPTACIGLAYMHSTGIGAEKNLKMAEVFKKRAEEIDEEMKQGIEFGQGLS